MRTSRFIRSLAVTVLAVSLGMLPGQAAAGPGGQAAGPPGGAPGSPGWDTPRTSARMPATEIVSKAAAGGTSDYVVTRAVGGSLRIRTYRAVGRRDAVSLVRWLQRLPGVLSVEPDRRDAHVLGDRSADLVPDDPRRPGQWALDTLHGESVWDHSRAAGITVAIVDTGVAHHEDLAESRILPGADFSGLGGDGRNDGKGHGTHCAGIVAATLDNGVGVSSLAPEASLLPVKVLNDYGNGTWSAVAQGITWATDHGSDVISMSLGGSSNSDAVAIAVQYALDHGVVVVAAAGNEREAGSPISYPAALPGVIGVAATDSNNQYAFFSNRGSYVDVSAPGVDVLSTLPGDQYEAWSGTSMATPYVSATAALVEARAAADQRSLTVDQVRDVIGLTSTDLGAPGRDDDYGDGLIDPLTAMAAVDNPATAPPDAPTGVAVTATDPHAGVVSWQHPGTGVLRFTAVATPTAGGAAVTCSVTAAERRCDLAHLAADTDYQVTVSATNLAGGADSQPVGFRTPPGPPDAGDTFASATALPASLTVAQDLYSDDDLDYWSFDSPGAGIVDISLGTLPADYDLYLYDAQGHLVDSSLNAGTDDDEIRQQLPAGHYVVLVRPYDPAVPGANYELAASVPQPPQPETPDAPRSLSARPGDRSAQVSFQAPASDGGASITTYEYSVAGGPWTARQPAGTASPLTVHGLTNGVTYGIRLRAVNSAGGGTPSAVVRVTPRTVPGSVTGVRAAAFPARGQMLVTWHPPAADGGSAVMGYRMRLSAAHSAVFGRWRATTQAHLLLSHLTRRARYQVEVVAVNAAGTSAATTGSLRQAGVAKRVRRVHVTRVSAHRARVSWRPPRSDGGSGVTGYRLRLSRAGSLRSYGRWHTTASRSQLLKGLRVGARYRVQIEALNSQGHSGVRTVRLRQARPRGA